MSPIHPRKQDPSFSGVGNTAAGLMSQITTNTTTQLRCAAMDEPGRFHNWGLLTPDQRDGYVEASCTSSFAQIEKWPCHGEKWTHAWRPAGHLKTQWVEVYLRACKAVFNCQENSRYLAEKCDFRKNRQFPMKLSLYLLATAADRHQAVPVVVFEHPDAGYIRAARKLVEEQKCLHGLDCQLAGRLRKITLSTKGARDTDQTTRHDRVPPLDSRHLPERTGSIDEQAGSERQVSQRPPPSPYIYEHDERIPRSYQTVGTVKNPAAIFATGAPDRAPSSVSASTYRTYTEQDDYLPALPQSAQDFLSNVPLGQYGQCLSYVTNHQGAVVQSLHIPLYLDEAVTAISRGDDNYAKNCIEKALIVEDCCKYRNTKDRLSYFQKLKDKNEKFMAVFLQRLQQKWTQCEQRQRDKGKQKRPDPRSVNRPYPPRHAGVPGDPGYGPVNYTSASRESLVSRPERQAAIPRGQSKVSHTKSELRAPPQSKVPRSEGSLIPGRMLGRVRVDRVPQEVWTTFGGLIIVHRSLYLLTVAHAFVDLSSVHSSSGKYQDADEARSISSAPSSGLVSDGQPQKAKIVLSQPLGSSIEKRPIELDFRPVDPISHKSLSSISLDWALLEVEPTEADGIAQSYSGTQERVDSVYSDLIPPQRPVTVFGGMSGIVQGRLEGDVSVLVLPWLGSAMTVWVVDCQTTKGDCGSWVVDQVQQVLYGIVVAHDPEMAETYIVPAHAIFQDIRRMFDVAPETEALLSSSEPLLWRPAQRSPTRHEYSPKRTQSSSPKYSFGTGSSTSRIGAAASRGHLQQLIRERASGPAFSLPVFALDAPASTRSLALRSRHAMHADPCTSLDSPPDVDLDRITFARLEGEGSDAGPEDELDRRYRQRTARDAGRLFQVGRVFSVQKHEDFNGDPKTYHTTPGCLLTKTSRGWIISRNSQYVVVKEGHGFCWAIPITTYGGLGTCKRGLSAAEVEAHAVVYSTSKPPSLLDGERPLTKTHIAVNCHGDHQLHRASRINFAKVTTIEHNVRVMDIGRIAPESLAHFNEYWKDEVFKQYGRRR